MSSEVLQTMRAGVDEHPQEIMNFLASFLMSAGGVLNKNGDDFKVVATTGLVIQVKQGRALVPKSSGLMAYPVWMHTDDADLTVGSNGSGNPRKDAVVLYIDEGEASPDTTGTNVAKLAIIAGTPAASPTAPDDSAIQSSLGGSNPFIRLANVTIASGDSELEDSDIEDARSQASFAIRGSLVDAVYQEWQTLTPGANVVIDLSKGSKFKITLNQHTTFSVINGKNGQTFKLRVTQAAGGGHTCTFWAGLGWGYNNTPVMTPTANKIDLYAFEQIASNVFDGTIVWQDR